MDFADRVSRGCPIEFKDGKIVEEWDGFDNLPFVEQLGFSMMPPAAEKK